MARCCRTTGDLHRHRLAWAFVEGLDLGPLYAAIKAVEGHAGHPPADLRMLMALWLNATIDGIGSARHLARLCEEHLAYRWLCGGVGVNAKTLADFRIGHAGLLEALLIDSVAALMKSGVARLERVAQDGVRVRASAGAASFRRASTLKRCRREAAEPGASLKAELEADPGAADRRHQAARRRAAREREQRVSQALEAAEALAKGRAEPAGGGTKTDGRDGDDAGGGDAGGDATKTAKEPRVSTTDPEARVMKMADGGFRPAYNVQFASDVESGVIAAVVVDATGSDMGKLAPMSDKLERDYGVRPGEHLADGGFAKHDDLIALAKAGVTSYVPVPWPRQADRARPGAIAICPCRRIRRNWPPGTSAWAGRRPRRSTGNGRRRPNFPTPRPAIAACFASRYAVARRRGASRSGMRWLTT